MNRIAASGLGIAVAACLTPHSVGRPDIEFVTVGAPGNAPYPLASPPGYISVQGRGRVDHEYRIGKYEVTTAQWMEFVNSYSVLGGKWTFFAAPTFWGAVQDPSHSGPGTKWILNASQPHAAMRPVYGISWREAAMFCNWLHNDKAPTLAAIADGAYDTSTFHPVFTSPFLPFKDQITHHPGARYWIPTLDEWMKAAHYDPVRYGPGQGGWWEYPHGSDEPPVGGLPGVGQSNANFTLPGQAQYQIPLGSYPGTLSPWGLLDTSGMTTEHTEFASPAAAPVVRGGRGSSAGSSTSTFDRIYMFQLFGPSSHHTGYGLRVASAIPGPAAPLALLAACLWVAIQRGRSSRPGAIQRSSVVIAEYNIPEL